VNIRQTPLDARHTKELGIDAVFVEPAGRPSFVTVNRTGGIDAGHLDISLWFLLLGRRGMGFQPDLTEFNEARWWSQAEIRAADSNWFDPNYLRFIEKVYV
jgi:8-oxo-dGTP diphosphatase